MFKMKNINENKRYISFILCPNCGEKYNMNKVENLYQCSNGHDIINEMNKLRGKINKLKNNINEIIDIFKIILNNIEKFYENNNQLINNYKKYTNNNIIKENNNDFKNI